MAFDDLTSSQRDSLLPLIKALRTGQFKEKFFLITHEGRQRGEIHLQYKHTDSGGQGLPGFTDAEVQAFVEAGYLSTSNYMAELKIKANREYEQYLGNPPEENGQVSNLDIFISHSSKDVDIAEALIDLLRAALTLKADRIRCTSVDGYRLQAGASTDDQLRREIYEARAFIGLITPASLQSTYVLFELGARWGARRHLAPVLAAGFDATSLRAPLTSLNSLSCDILAQVYQLVGDIASSIGITAGSPSAYQKYVNALVELSQQGAEYYRSETSVAEAAAQVVSAKREQLSEHDRVLFEQFLKEFPSQGEMARFLRDHDIGGSFQSSVLDALYDFIRQWNNAEHEFNNSEVENKRGELLNSLNIFVRELIKHTSSTHREGWLSIKEMIGRENIGEFFRIQEKLNDLATEAYKAHQDLIREVNRHL